jgi:hypothetical protein
LTRLPGDLRLQPQDAARLLAERFAPPLLLAQKATRRLTDTFARLGISVRCMLAVALKGQSRAIGATTSPCAVRGRSFA